MYAVSLRFSLTALALLLALPATAEDRFTLLITEDAVQDEQTGLVWQRNGTRKAVNFTAALDYCQQLTLGGLNHWRLPGVKELISLVDEAHYKPSAFPIFKTSANLYWSSTVNPKRPGLNWTVNFSDGHVHAFREALDFSVRCVSD